MKHSKSPIWQKKRKKKYKKAINKKGTPYHAKKTQAVHKQTPPKIVPKAKKTKRIRIPKFRFTYDGINVSPVWHWLQKHDSDVQLILFPSILLVILIILSIFNNQIFLTIARQEPIIQDQVTYLHPYPYMQAANAPTITAKAAIILDRDSQVILYDKNPQLRFSMASTTKIMTATIALNHYKPDDTLTVKRSYVPGSGLSFSSGEQFHFMDLMYAMLLPSANDAAQAIADNYPGGSDAFVKQMNKKAQSLHLTNTHYSDPVGLDDDGDYSTVVDLARLASYAISNPTFVDITSTKYKTISTTNFSRQYPLTNLNKLLGIDGVTGIKTGTTEGAGEVLVTSVVKNGHTYIVIVMDSTDRFSDTQQLLNYIDANVKYVVPSPSTGK
ncbi:MAG TPA: serine hydrolase [Candidatus Acidoferrales bacterium]|nr:serine hydrolase [Candidatus Acidoferrales bacterium]